MNLLNALGLDSMLKPAIWYMVSKDLHILSWYNAGVFLVCAQIFIFQ